MGGVRANQSDRIGGNLYQGRGMGEVKDNGSPFRGGYHRPIPAWMKNSLGIAAWIHDNRDCLVVIVIAAAVFSLWVTA